MASVRLSELHAALGGELLGDGTVAITRIASLEAAGPGSISFAVGPKFRAQVAASQASCLIVPPELRDDALARGAVLVTPDAYLYFARLTQWWAARHRASAPAGVHASAVVAADAVLGEGVSVGPFAVVEAGAVLGAHAVVGAHSVVSSGVTVGEHTRLAPRVSLMSGTRVGARCIVHSGAVIGADGFGFAPSAGQWIKIEQLGGVLIGDDVEIGANTCIDRGALDDTVIEDGVKLDNQIQIGHNVHIGAHSAMAGCVGVAGSTRIGRGCTVGGAGMVLGHLTLADGVHISACSVVSRSIHKPGLYSGFFPLDDNAAWERNAATLRHLHSLRDRVRALEKKQADE